MKQEPVLPGSTGRKLYSKKAVMIGTLLYAWLGQFAAQKLQGEFLDKHAANGGRFYSNWMGAFIGVIVAIIFLCFLFLSLMFAELV